MALYTLMRLFAARKSIKIELNGSNRVHIRLLYIEYLICSKYMIVSLIKNVNSTTLACSMIHLIDWPHHCEELQ